MSMVALQNIQNVQFTAVAVKCFQDSLVKKA